MKGGTGMKTVTFITGVAAGMAVATAALTSMYPDVPRRMARDSRRALRKGRRVAHRIGGMFHC